MAKYQYVRELPASFPEAGYWERHAREGWKLTAIEWKREVAEDGPATGEAWEVPYGLRIAGDCLHLEDDRGEREVLLVMLESIVQDHRLSQVAESLNARGFRTRQGKRWAPATVFDLLPRLIEAGPSLLSSAEWAERRRQLMALL